MTQCHVLPVNTTTCPSFSGIVDDTVTESSMLALTIGRAYLVLRGLSILKTFRGCAHGTQRGQRKMTKAKVICSTHNCSSIFEVDQPVDLHQGHLRCAACKCLDRVLEVAHEYEEMWGDTTEKLPKWVNRLEKAIKDYRRSLE